MRRFIKHTFPEKFFETPALWQSLLLGLVYLLLLIAQLFTYEDFPGIVRGYGLPGGEAMVMILCVVLPLVELASLPYLLSMKLAPVIHNVSRFAVIATPGLWLLLSTWLVLQQPGVESGLFGGTISTTVSIWMPLYAVLMLVASVVVVRERKAL